MNYTKVESSNLAEVGWKDETLHIRFHHGGEYAYDGVAYGVFTDLISAPSVGKFFHAEVKERFPFRKIGACVEA